MKPFHDNEPYISKAKIRKILLAASIMILALYIVAAIFSLCGSNYFILNYQNDQMDRIENFMREHQIISLISWAFSTLEFSLIAWFCIKKRPKVYYIVPYYLIRVIIAFLVKLPSFVTTIYTISFFFIIFVLDQFITNKKFSIKEFGFQSLRLLIAEIVSCILQAIILVIKAGYFDGVNHIMSLSAHFCYAIEFDIALSVILFTISLYMYREKGDSKQWTIYHTHSGSSQTSTTKSPKLKLKKQLTKTQRNKLFWLYVKLYVIQIGTFLLVMVLPFLLGKLFEFLLMYLSFCVTRYILGFRYSLHFKKESLCALVGVIVFGILSLAVPFFYVVVIIAILLGIALAVLLHLSYKYRSMWLFNHIAKPDKFADFYTLFDGNLDPHYVKTMSMHRGLDEEQANILVEYTNGNKISYIAKKFNYSDKSIERKLNDILEIIAKNS